MFYYVGCCTYHESSEIKNLVSGAKSLMFFHIQKPTPLNLTDSVKSKHEIKTYLLATTSLYLASTSFLVLNLSRVSYDLYKSDLYHKCNAVPGELPCKFTTLEKPYIHIELVK